MKYLLGLGLGLGLILCLSSCATVPNNKKGSQDVDTQESDLQIIDAHIHTGFDNQPEETSQIPYSQEQLLKEFKDNNVVGAVSMNGRNGGGYVDFSQIANNKTQVIHCVGVNLPPDKKMIEDGLKSKKYGCIKIYLGYLHAYAYDKPYRPLYTLAEKYNVPVVFHTGDTYSTKGKLKYSDPLTIDEVAVDFPKVKFVIAHVGNPWIQSAAEVAYKNPNVFVDASALLIGKLSEYSESDLKTYVVDPLSWAFGYMENPKKLMFATDWPLVSIKDYATVLKKAIPKEHWEKVFRTNAQEVFGFKDLK